MQSRDAEENLIRVIHRAKKPKNFRPHTHDRIMTMIDDLFLLRFTSYQHYVELFQQWKMEIFDSFLLKPVDQIATWLNRIKYEVYSVSTVSIFHYQSDLSDPDREYSLQRVFLKLNDRLAEDMEVLLCPFIQHHSVTSSSRITIEMILLQIAELVSQHPKVSKLLTKKLHSMYYQHLKEGDPVEFIQQILTLYETSLSSLSLPLSSTSSSAIYPRKKIVLMISFPFYELLQNQSMITLLITLFEQRNWQTIFFIGQHRTNSTDVITSNLNNLLSISYYPMSFVSSKQIFEKIIIEIFIKGKLPIQFTYSIIEKLYREFYDFICCNSTFLQRILMILQSHFEERKSILCMVSEWEWLVSMHLVKGLSYFLSKQGSSIKDREVDDLILNGLSSDVSPSFLEMADHENQTTTDSTVMSLSVAASKPLQEEDYVLKSLSELLHSLKAVDLPLNSAFAFSKAKLSFIEKEQEIKQMKQQHFDLFWEIRLYLKVMFQFFKVCRDSLLIKTQRENFSTPILWKEMINVHPSAKPNSFFFQFSYQLTEQLTQLPMNKIGNFLKSDLSLFAPLQVWKQFHRSEFQDFYQDFLYNIRTLNETYELIQEEILQQCPSLYQYSLQKLKQLYTHYQHKQKKSVGTTITAVAAAVPHGSQQRDLAFTEAEFLVLQEVVEATEDEEDHDNQDSEEIAPLPSHQILLSEKIETSKKQGKVNHGKVMTISHYHILEEFISNIQRWISTCIELFFSLVQFSPDWKGILTIDFFSSPLMENKDEILFEKHPAISLQQQFLFLSEDILRQKFVQSLKGDCSKSAQNGKLVDYYLTRIQRSQSTETAISWFSAYQDLILKNQSDHHSSTPATLQAMNPTVKKAKKRKPEEMSSVDNEGAVKNNTEDHELAKVSQLPMEARCILANTLYDFEKTGMISLKKSDHKHITVLKSIYTGING